LQKKLKKIKILKEHDAVTRINSKRTHSVFVSISIILFLLMALFMGPAACSNSGTTVVSENNQSSSLEVSNSREDNSSENKNLLIVGSDITYPPFEFTVNGDIAGFDIDLIKEIASRMKKEIEIIPSSWDPEFTDLIEGKLDIMISAVPIEADKMAIIDYSNPYYALEYLMISLSGSEIKTKEELAGKKIGILEVGKSYINKDYLFNYDVSDYEDIMDMLDALGNREIEAVLINLPVAVNLLKDNKDMYIVLDKINSSREFAIVFKKGSSLVSEVNQILDTMVADGKFQSIYDKWFNYNF